jgi:UDP-glucose 4-epimerase
VSDYEQVRTRVFNPWVDSLVVRMLADAGAAYGLPAIALRYFNAEGADSDGDIGEDHNPEQFGVTIWIDRSLWMILGNWDVVRNAVGYA